MDTNIVSELRKPRPERKVLAFMDAHPLASLYISELTLAELRFGIELTADPLKRSILKDWLARNIRPIFEGRVLPVGEDILVKWTILIHEGRKRRITYAQPDLFIAAALHHGLVVVTRDADEFERAGAETHNPWR